MQDDKINPLSQKVDDLVSDHQQTDDHTGWFDVLYRNASGNPEQIPWARMQPHPCLKNWLETVEIINKKALVIGCGLGDDSEILAQKGAKVTAFDIAPSSIEWCKKRFPNSSVDYLVADLLKLAPSWKNSFDLIFESRTIQALPLKIRAEVIEAIATLLKPRGTLLIVTHLRETKDSPDGPPWPVSEEELSQLSNYGYEEIARTPYISPNLPSIQQALIEYQRNL
ncbi:MAG: class I SAM-dependent methyltransferase [Crocosphaera sp.]|nr:class I SAM-dependent methyltransferase [Crocosphaera sp.]